jgi:hypothetical protein
MPTDPDAEARADAIRQLADASREEFPECGPEPQRPNYYSTQAQRDAWIKWNLCRSGVRD